MNLRRTKNKAEELVSIIITTYRRPVEIVRRAVESAMNQTYLPIEIYVVNDAPEDLLWRNCICSGSMSLIRREVFEQCGYFDERFRSR